MPELKIEHRLKRKDSSNNDKIIHDGSPFVNNNNSPFKHPKIWKLKQYVVFVNECLNKTKESKSTGEKIDYPNKFDLIKRSKFGKPYFNRSFTSSKAIENVLLFIFESKHLTKAEIASLLSSKLTFKIFDIMFSWSKHKNFNSLLVNEESYLKQTVKTLTTCLFYYNLHLPSVVKYIRPRIHKRISRL